MKTVLPIPIVVPAMVLVFPIGRMEYMENVGSVLDVNIYYNVKLD